MSIIKLSNNGVKNATAFGSVGSGAMTFIKKLTASSSATLSFVDGSSSVVLDNTYKEYLFTFKNIHPATNLAEFSFNLSADSGSNYNVTKTSTSFDAFNQEAGSDQGLRHDGDGGALAQSTNFQNLHYDLGNGNDSNLNGFLHLFEPSSTTFVKHYIASVNWQYHDTYAIQAHTSGYGNTTSAIDAIQFKFSSGNIDAGDICLYGIN